MAMRLGSLFAGIGGFDLAAERAGMEVVFQSENDPKASAVLDHHWSHVKNFGDIHEITDAPRADVLTGGFPCQDYSVAGRRGGLAGDRGALWWEYHRLITDLRPTWVIGENVPGLLSSRDGADFETIVGSLTECGYGVAWAVLDAQYFGVAQRRRRVFIVGHSGGEPRPEILALGEGVFGHPEPSREDGQTAARGLATSAFNLRGRDGGAQAELDDLANLRAAGGGSSRSYLSVTPVQAAGAWGSNGAGVSDPDAPMFTLDSTGAQSVAFAQNQRDEVRDLGDLAGGLQSEPGMKQQTYVAQGIVSKGNGEAFLTGDKVTSIAQGGGQLGQGRPAVMYGPTVRRLTPLECERLQGFPDGWTDIPGNSDTQRYRQLGNAVAVPVVEWIMRRIVGA